MGEEARDEVSRHGHSCGCATGQDTRSYRVTCSNRSVADLEVERSFRAPGKHLCGMAWDGRYLWHSDGDTGLLYQLNSGTGAVLREIVCGEVRTDLGYDGANLWQIAGHPKRIRVIEPAEGHQLREVDLGDNRESACGLHVSGDSYWIGLKQAGRIEERLMRDGKVIRSYRTTGRADGVALTGSTLWYTDYDQSLLQPSTLKLGRRRVDSRSQETRPGSVGMVQDSGIATTETGSIALSVLAKS